MTEPLYNSSDQRMRYRLARQAAVLAAMRHGLTTPEVLTVANRATLGIRHGLTVQQAVTAAKSLIHTP